MSNAETTQHDMLWARVSVEPSPDLKTVMSQLVLHDVRSHYLQPHPKSRLQNKWYLHTGHPVLLENTGVSPHDHHLIEKYEVSAAKNDRGTNLHVGHLALSSFFGSNDDRQRLPSNNPDVNLMMRLALSPRDYAYRRLTQPPFQDAPQHGFLFVTHAIPGEFAVPYGEERDAAYARIRRELGVVANTALTKPAPPLDNRQYYMWHVAVDAAMVRVAE